MDRARKLGEGGIPWLLVKYSAPAIVGMLAQATYNIVDRIFIGQAVGPLGIAGATLSFPFFLVFMAFSMLIGLGAAALVSIRLGERRQDEAERVLGNAVVLLVAISVLLTVLGLWFLEPLLRLCGASERSLPYARDYAQLIVGGSIFQSMGFGLNALIRGEGNPRIAMMTLLIGAVLNAILDPIFLFWFGWGMRGAAAATVISQAVSMVWVVSYFLRGKSLLHLHRRNMRLSWSLSKSIIGIGSPMFSMQLAASAMNAILNNQLRIHGGDLAISVIGIVHAVALFIAMPIFGLNQGAQPVIGYNFGAKRYDRVRKTLQTAILYATALCLVGFLIVMTYPTQIIGLFHRGDAELVRLGTRALRISLVMFPIIGFQIVSANYFQAVGKPMQALLLGLSRQVLLLIPAILVLPHFWELDGVWAALPTADACSSILTGVCLYYELRHLNDRHQQSADGQPSDVLSGAEIL